MLLDKYEVTDREVNVPSDYLDESYFSSHGRLSWFVEGVPEEGTPSDSFGGVGWLYAKDFVGDWQGRRYHQGINWTGGTTTTVVNPVGGFGDAKGVYFEFEVSVKSGSGTDVWTINGTDVNGSTQSETLSIVAEGPGRVRFRTAKVYKSITTAGIVAPSALNLTADAALYYVPVEHDPKVYFTYGDVSHDVDDWLVEYDVKKDVYKKLAKLPDKKYEAWQIAVSKNFDTFFVTGVSFQDGANNRGFTNPGAGSSSTPPQIFRYVLGATPAVFTAISENDVQMGLAHENEDVKYGKGVRYKFGREYDSDDWRSGFGNVVYLPTTRKSFQCFDGYLYYSFATSAAYGVKRVLIASGSTPEVVYSQSWSGNPSTDSSDLHVASAYDFYVDVISSKIYHIVLKGNGQILVRRTGLDGTGGVDRFDNFLLDSKGDKIEVLSFSDVVYFAGNLYFVVQCIKGSGKFTLLLYFEGIDGSSPKPFIVKGYRYFAESACSPCIHDGSVYYFQGSPYFKGPTAIKDRSAYLYESTEHAGHLIKVDGCVAEDLGSVWRSARVNPADSDDEFYGEHFGCISKMLSDGENLHFICGYRFRGENFINKANKVLVDYKTEKKTKWKSSFPFYETVYDTDPIYETTYEKIPIQREDLLGNWHWIQYGKALNYKFPILPVNGTNAWALLETLARLTSSTIGFREGKFIFEKRTQKVSFLVDRLRASDSTLDLDLGTGDVFDESGTLLIDSEVLTYSGKEKVLVDGKYVYRLTGLERGSEETTVGFHWKYSRVVSVDAFVFNRGRKKNLVDVKISGDFEYILNKIKATYGFGDDQLEYVTDDEDSINANEEQLLEIDFPMMDRHQREWVKKIVDAQLFENRQANFFLEIVLRWSPHIEIGDILAVYEYFEGEGVVEMREHLERGHLDWVACHVLDVKHDYTKSQTMLVARSLPHQKLVLEDIPANELRSEIITGAAQKKILLDNYVKGARVVDVHFADSDFDKASDFDEGTGEVSLPAKTSGTEAVSTSLTVWADPGDMKPKFIEVPEDPVVVAGDSYVFYVKTEGYPSPTFTISSNSIGAVIGSSSGVIVVKVPSGTAAGDYKVTLGISNDCGSDEKEVKFVVKAAATTSAQFASAPTFDETIGTIVFEKDCYVDYLFPAVNDGEGDITYRIEGVGVLGDSVTFGDTKARSLVGALKIAGVWKLRYIAKDSVDREASIDFVLVVENSPEWSALLIGSNDVMLVDNVSKTARSFKKTYTTGERPRLDVDFDRDKRRLEVDYLGILPVSTTQQTAIDSDAIDAFNGPGHIRLELVKDRPNATFSAFSFRVTDGDSSHADETLAFSALDDVLITEGVFSAGDFNVYPSAGAPAGFKVKVVALKNDIYLVDRDNEGDVVDRDWRGALYADGYKFFLALDGMLKVFDSTGLVLEYDLDTDFTDNGVWQDVALLPSASGMYGFFDRDAAQVRAYRRGGGSDFSISRYSTLDVSIEKIDAEFRSFLVDRGNLYVLMEDCGYLFGWNSGVSRVFANSADMKMIDGVFGWQSMAFENNTIYVLYKDSNRVFALDVGPSVVSSFRRAPALLRKLATSPLETLELSSLRRTDDDDDLDYAAPTLSAVLGSSSGEVRLTVSSSVASSFFSNAESELSGSNVRRYGYDVRYKLSSASEWSSWYAVSGSPESDSVLYVFQNLQTSNSLDFQAREYLRYTADGEFVYVYSDLSSVLTLSAADQVPDYISYTYESGNGQAVFSWTYYGTGGAPTWYEYAYGVSPNPADWVQTTATSVTIENLANGSSIYFRLRAGNDHGAGPATQSTFFVIGVPSPATGVEVTVDGDSATVTWTPGSGNGASVTSQRIWLDSVHVATVGADVGTYTATGYRQVVTSSQ